MINTSPLPFQPSQAKLEVNHHSLGDWTKYDERLIECVQHGDVERLKYVRFHPQLSVQSRKEHPSLPPNVPLPGQFSVSAVSANTMLSRASVIIVPKIS